MVVVVVKSCDRGAMSQDQFMTKETASLFSVLFFCWNFRRTRMIECWSVHS